MGVRLKYIAAKIDELLTNIDNFISGDMGLTETEKATARSNIGASAFSGNYNDLSNKPAIPTNNNELTNGAGYITSAGRCAYAASAGSAPANGGTADCVRTQSAGGVSHGNNWRMFFRHDGAYFRPKFMQSDGSVADNATAVNYADLAGSSTFASSSSSWNVSCLRNQMLVSADTTPTEQGAIYWTFQ